MDTEGRGEWTEVSSDVSRSNTGGESLVFSNGKTSILVLLAALIAPLAASAQTESGIVRVRAVGFDGTPIRGALVALLGSDGNAVVEGLTDNAGFRSLSAFRGRYRVRIRRIGFEPFVSPEISLPYEGELKLAIADTRISLATVIVTAGSQCKHTGVDQRAIGVLWEEISKALVGTQLTRSDFAGLGSARWYRKEVGRRGEVVKLDTTIRKLNAARPFFAEAPRALAANGYVNGDMKSGWVYFAPDETVLLSTEFANTHCFRVVRDKKRPRQVGLSFAPVPGREISDIDGVLWLDEQSAELREILFHFVNIGDLTKFKPGGRVHFRRMASGAWLVDDWSLRFPILELTLNRSETLVQIGYVENGGVLVESSLQAAATVRPDQ